MKPLTRKEASERSGLSMSAIDELIVAGTWTTWKFGNTRRAPVRIDAEEFDRWMDAHKKTTTGVNTHRRILRDIAG